MWQEFALWPVPEGGWLAPGEKRPVLFRFCREQKLLILSIFNTSLMLINCQCCSPSSLGVWWFCALHHSPVLPILFPVWHSELPQLHMFNPSACLIIPFMPCVDGCVSPVQKMSGGSSLEWWVVFFFSRAAFALLMSEFSWNTHRRLVHKRELLATMDEPSSVSSREQLQNPPQSARWLMLPVCVEAFASNLLH